MSDAPRASGGGRLFPAYAALVARDGTSFILVNRAGRRVAIDGPICEEIERSLEQAALTPRLRALVPAHPALRELAAWLGTPAVPLTRLDALRLDGFDTLFVELLGRCNERCVHCYADASPTVDEALEHDVVIAALDDARRLGFRRVQLTGGDPLLCAFLPGVIAHARAIGIPEIEIFTNGLALTEELIDQLAPHRPGFALSVYSADPDEHDRVTRTPGSHRRTFAAIDRAVARGLVVRAAVIVVDQEGDPQTAVELLKAHGVTGITWTRTLAVGRGVVGADASRAKSIEIELPEGGAHAGEVAACGKLCITYSGDVVPCIFQRRTTLGNVRAGGLARVLAAPATRGLALPIAGEAARRLQCDSCRLTELGLAFAGRAA